MRSRAVLVAPLLAASLLLSGCVGQNNQPSGGQTPDPVSSEAILVSLQQIDPGFDDEDAVDAADQVCAAVEEGEDTDAVDELTLELFGELAENEFTEADAQQVVVTVTSDYCG